MKKLALALLIVFITVLSFQSCSKDKQTAPMSFESELTQDLNKLTNDASDLLHIYHKNDMIQIDYESDGFVIGFAQGVAGKIKPICKSSNKYKFAKCVGKYIGGGNCCTISYHNDTYYAYPADCPEEE